MYWAENIVYSICAGALHGGITYQTANSYIQKQNAYCYKTDGVRRNEVILIDENGSTGDLLYRCTCVFNVVNMKAK